MSADGSPVRVAHVIRSLQRGGAEVALASLVLLSDRAQAEHHVVFHLDAEPSVGTELEAAGAHLHRVVARHRAGLELGTVRALRRIDADVVHLHTPSMGLSARFGAGRKGRRISTLHLPLTRLRRLPQWIERATYRFDSAAFAVSSEVAASYRAITGPPPKELHLGVHILDLRRRALAMAEPPCKPPWARHVVATVANLRPQKNLSHLIEVMDLLPNDVVAVIVGDGPLRTELEEQARRIGVEERVIFTGALSDPVPLIASADVFCLPSAYEGLPIALMEAMAVGTAVVASDVGGIAEIVVDGVTGLLTDPLSPATSAEAIRRLLTDVGLRGRVVEGARRVIEERFSAETAVHAFEAEYRR